MLDADLIRITVNSWIQILFRIKLKRRKHSHSGSPLEMTRLTMESWRVQDPLEIES
jgi:hypothetical protein